METLFYEYDTEILWCDIGGASIFRDIGEHSLPTPGSLGIDIAQVPPGIITLRRKAGK